MLILEEALGLMACSWVGNLQPVNVNFEMNSKLVVDSVYGCTIDVSNFASIINDCMIVDIDFHRI